MSSITRDEWLKAFGDAAQPCDPDAMTVPEIGQMLGLERHTAYRYVMKLVEEGKATLTRKMVTGRSGVTKRIPAYKLVKADAARPATRKR